MVVSRLAGPASGMSHFPCHVWVGANTTWGNGLYTKKRIHTICVYTAQRETVCTQINVYILICVNTAERNTRTWVQEQGEIPLLDNDRHHQRLALLDLCFSV